MRRARAPREGWTGFLGLSAIAHRTVAGPWFPRCAAGLRRGRNVARRVEHSISSS